MTYSFTLGLPPVASSKQGGYVYYVQCDRERSGPIKIGHTKDLKKRLGDLQNMNGYKLTFLGFREGTLAVEKGLHTRLRSYRLHGEWFDSVPAVFEALIGPSCVRDKSTIITEFDLLRGWVYMGDSCKQYGPRRKAWWAACEKRKQARVLVVPKKKYALIDVDFTDTSVGFTREAIDALNALWDQWCDKGWVCLKGPRRSHVTLGHQDFFCDGVYVEAVEEMMAQLMPIVQGCKYHTNANLARTLFDTYLKEISERRRQAELAEMDRKMPWLKEMREIRERNGRSSTCAK